jgi:hypothetical protein
MRQKRRPVGYFLLATSQMKAHRIRKDSTYCVIRSKKWQVAEWQTLANKELSRREKTVESLVKTDGGRN